MPEVVRVGKYVVVIYPDDHTPAHVHVKFARCQVRVLIAETPVMATATKGKPKAQEIRHALEIVAANLAACRATWKEIHGDE